MFEADEGVIQALIRDDWKGAAGLLCKNRVYEWEYELIRLQSFCLLHSICFEKDTWDKFVAIIQMMKMQDQYHRHKMTKWREYGSDSR